MYLIASRWTKITKVILSSNISVIKTKIKFKSYNVKNQRYPNKQNEDIVNISVTFEDSEVHIDQYYF